MRSRNSRRLVPLLALVTALVLAAGCGSSSGSSNSGGTGGSGNSDATIIMGTTDTAVHFDPGDAYDLHSWNVIYNVYDELMVIPPGGNQPVPSLAQSCNWDDTTHYTCKLRPGVKFQDGSPLTSADVAYSFQRSIEINGDQGVCSLFSSLATAAPGRGPRSRPPTISPSHST